MSFEVKIGRIRKFEDEVELIAKASGGEDTNIMRHRYHLQLLCQECIIEYPTESHLEGVEYSLWKNCFYQPINFYRQHAKDQSTPKGKYAISEINRIIDAGLGAFIMLLHDVLSASEGATAISLCEIFEMFGFPTPSGHKIVPGLDALCNKLLVIIGDLARYRCQFSRTFHEDSYNLAWRIYNVAKRLQPENGHAANQLAVVGSLLNDSLMTTLWYLRAECCTMPFKGAKKNLLAYLEKVIAKDHQDEWRPVIIFVRETLENEDKIVDPSVLASWLKNRSTKIQPSEFAAIIMILCACLEITSDRQAASLHGILDVFISCDRDNSIFRGSPSDRAIILVSLLAVCQLIEINDIRPAILEWISAEDVNLSPAARSRLEDLKGFSIFDEIVETLPKIPNNHPLLTSMLERNSVLARRIKGSESLGTSLDILLALPINPSDHSAMPLQATRDQVMNNVDDDGDEIQFCGLIIDKLVKI